MFISLYLSTSIDCLENQQNARCNRFVFSFLFPRFSFFPFPFPFRHIRRRQLRMSFTSYTCLCFTRLCSDFFDRSSLESIRISIGAFNIPHLLSDVTLFAFFFFLFFLSTRVLKNLQSKIYLYSTLLDIQILMNFELFFSFVPSENIRTSEY